MNINVEVLNNQLSAVRGIGSYNQMLREAILEYGDKYNLFFNKENYDINLITDFNFFKKISIKPHVKNVVVIHDLIPLKYPQYFPIGLLGRYKWFVNLRTIRKISGIITDSEAVKQELQTKLKIDWSRIMVVYPAAKAIFSNKNKNVKVPNFINKIPKNFVLYTGDITWNKNLPRLAKAIKKINQTLVLVGQALSNRENINHPWQKSFADFLNEIDKDKRFVFLNYVTDMELLWLYQNAKVVALPSLDEGFGLTWLEASWQGTPVLVGRTKVAKEIMQTAAHFVDPKSTDSIASGLETLMFGNNNKLIKQELNRAGQLSQEHFVAYLSKALYNLGKQ